MNHIEYAGALRQRIQLTLGKSAIAEAEVLRPDENPFGGEKTFVGRIEGYRYIKHGSSAALSLGIPGELANAFDTEYLMDLTPGLPVLVKAGDTLVFTTGEERRVSDVRPSGGFSGRDAYRTYRLEAV